MRHADNQGFATFPIPAGTVTATDALYVSYALQDQRQKIFVKRDDVADPYLFYSRTVHPPDTVTTPPSRGR